MDKMKDHARVVVIGGGVIGCSVLNYLTEFGWTDVVLVEKNELTAGATWHAAANTLLADDSPALNRINILSQSLYRRFEQETGESVGFHRAGCLRVARTPDMLERLRGKQRIAHYTDIRYEMLDRDQLFERNPLLNIDKYIGASWAPDEGYMDPSLATNGFARTARSRGAKIYRQTKVTGLSPRASGEWLVETEKGNIVAEHVIVCTGMWAPELTRLLGYELPTVTIERQYLVTENLPDEYQDLGFEIPLTHDFAAPFYVRQLGKGLIVGVHDQHTVYCFQNGIPETFGQELFPIDLDRVSISLNEAVTSVPVLERTGIRTEVCGPTSRTPDLNGMLGPLAGFRNLYVAAAWASGITQGAGIGYLAAEWIVEGEPSLDTSPIDVARFGPYANRRYVKAILDKGHNFGTTDTNNAAERMSGRPARTSPLYPILREKGAVFGPRMGWECPLWFHSAEGEGEEWSATLAEARHILGKPGISDASSKAKFAVAGGDAANFLARLCSDELPAVGESRRVRMLNRRGEIAAEVVVARLGDEQFYLTAPARAERRLHGWLSGNLPVISRIAIDNLTARHGALLLAGPGVLDLLAGFSEADFKRPDAVVEAEMGFSLSTVLTSAEFDLPMVEMHMPMEYLVSTYERLLAASPDLANFGLGALDVHRLHKGRPEWSTDFGSAAMPWAAALAGSDDSEGSSAKQAIAADRLAIIEADEHSTAPKAGDALYQGDKIVALARTVGPSLESGRPRAIVTMRTPSVKHGTLLNWNTSKGLISAKPIFFPVQTRHNG